MKKKECSLEKEILKGLAAGDLTPELQNHMSACPLCRESASVYHWMNRFQRLSWQEKTAKKRLPQAEFLWERAFSSQQPDQELVKKAMKPLRIYQVLSYVLAIIVPIFLVLIYWPEVRGLIQSSPAVNMILKWLSSSSFLLMPMLLGFFSIVAFTLITGFEPKKA